MNKKQKILTLVALGVFVLTLFAIPLNDLYMSTTYIWYIPYKADIRFDVLFLEWRAIGLISVILFFFLKDKNPL